MLVLGFGRKDLCFRECSFAPLEISILGLWNQKPWNTAFSQGICHPKPRDTNPEGTNFQPFKGWDLGFRVDCWRVFLHCVGILVGKGFDWRRPGWLKIM